MELQINTIMGMNVGIEYFEDQAFGPGLILDLFILRFILFFTSQDDYDNDEDFLGI